MTHPDHQTPELGIPDRRTPDRQTPDRQTPDRQTLGRLGEDAAVLAYAAAGLRPVARRWRRAEGELDLVLRRDDLLVFCEVKARRGRRCGLPEEAVGPRRLARLRRVVRRYLHEEPPRGVQHFRFDVAAVEFAPDGGGLSVRLLRGVG